jgi:hypothetical protein
LEEEVLDEFVTDHVRIIHSQGSLVQKILEIFARLQVPSIKALTLARLRFCSLFEPVHYPNHRHHDSAHDGKGSNRPLDLDNLSLFTSFHVCSIGHAKLEIK